MIPELSLMLLADVGASTLQLLGAGGFGALIGWYVYYINRYRKSDVELSDIVTLLGAIGGGAVMALFEKKTDLFGAYGIGLALGFFGYFVVLLLLVRASQKTIDKNFSWEWFLDGRRKNPIAPWGYPEGHVGEGGRPMIQGGRPMGEGGNPQDGGLAR